MNRADCKALRGAAILLSSWAKSLEGTGLDDEQRKHVRFVARLRKIANAEQAKLPPKKSGNEIDHQVKP